MNAFQTLPRAHAIPAQAPTSPRGILVVDDDEITRSLLGTFFRQQGFFVWLASDGEEAVQIFEDYHDEIAFVVMELDMPGMMGPRPSSSSRSSNRMSFVISLAATGLLKPQRK